MSVTKNNELSNKRPSYKEKKDRSFKFIFISVIAFFLGIGLCIGLYNYTLMTIYQLSKFLVGFTVVGFLIPLKYYQKWLHFIKYETIIFNVIGVGPFFTGLFLLLNFIYSNDPYTHNYKIEKIYFEGEDIYTSVGVVLEDNVFSGERKVVGLTDHEISIIMGKSHMKITIYKGLFGYDVIKEKVFVND